MVVFGSDKGMGRHGQSIGSGSMAGEGAATERVLETDQGALVEVEVEVGGRGGVTVCDGFGGDGPELLGTADDFADDEGGAGTESPCGLDFWGSRYCGRTVLELVPDPAGGVGSDEGRDESGELVCFFKGVRGGTASRTLEL